MNKKELISFMSDIKMIHGKSKKTVRLWSCQSFELRDGIKHWFYKNLTLA